MNTHRCKTPGCKHVIFGGAERCYHCRKTIKYQKKREAIVRDRNKPALDLSTINPDLRKYVGKIHEGTTR